jgi:hypothetical protein
MHPMRDIEALIAEYCAQYLPPEPVWITVLNRRFPKISKRLDAIKSVQWEIQDHLRNSYEAFLSKGQSPELAWKSAQDRFGDAALISLEIREVCAQSHKCLLIRFLAVVMLLMLPLGSNARLQILQFFHPLLLFLMAACAAAGILITRKRDSASLRRYAFCGAWLGLIWGVIRVASTNAPEKLGAGIAAILLSTFYGLFLAAPSARGIIPAAMMLICHIGVLIPCMRAGLLFCYPDTVNLSLLKIVLAFSIVSVLVGLTVFDVRRLHRRLSGVAAFSMVFGYIQILSNLTRDNGNLFYLLCVTSIPPLVAVLMALPIRKLQDRLLLETN